MKLQLAIHEPLVSRWRHILAAVPHLRDLGIEIVCSNPDALLVNYHTLNPQHLSGSENVVVLWRQDASAIYDSRVLEYAGDPAVIAVFQNHLISPKSLSSVSAGRYHYLLTSESHSVEPPPGREEVLPSALLDKFHQVLWDCDSSFLRFEQSGLFAIDVDFSKPRPYDVHCVLNGDPGVKRDLYFDIHRHALVQRLAKARHLKVFGKGLEERGMDWSEYIAGMLSSKVVVSPWGFGEYCHRDVEALLCGCVLVKPDSSFVSTEPDFLRSENTYVRCRPDFSDIEETIARIIHNWDSYEGLRRTHRAMFVDHPLRSPHHYASYFASKLYSVLGT